jgi:hypothetical protein
MASAPNVKIISRESLDDILRNRMGLILGPSATHGPTFYDQVSKRLSEAFAVPIGATVFDTSDAVLDKDIEDSAVRDVMRDFITAYTPVPGLRGLAQIRWSGVLSLCMDHAFDTPMQQDAAAHAARHPVTILADPFTPLPPRHTPLAKLLGSIQRDDFCCSTATYKARVSTWNNRVRVFADLVQGSPIVCLGLADTPWLMQDVFSAMFAQATTAPSAVIFLSSEIGEQDRLLRRFVPASSSVYLVKTTLADLVGAAVGIQSKSVQLRLPYGDRIKALFDALHDNEELAVLVNAHTQSSISKDEHHRLADLLFSPSLPRWDPFVHQLDFQRTLTKDLVDDVRLLAASPTQGSSVVVLKGSAASGKTTALKRAAFDLANAGVDVLWLKPGAYQDSPRAIANVFSRMKEHLEGKLVVFMDDPISFGTLAVSDVAAAAANTFVDVVLVTALRSSDWAVRDELDVTGGLQQMGEFDIEDDFDNAEWGRLPKYLVRLGAFPDIQSATAALSARESKTARDTLSVLYWMLPGAKTTIQRGVREEYFRLGDAAAFTRLVIGDENHTSELLRRAYGMVAVASRWTAPLPVEVLVTALNVAYGEWLESAGNQDGFGLFYPAEIADGTGTSYRTRNAVVTEVIVELINGGRLSHSGEFHHLQEMVSACTGTQPPYRDFALNILLRNPRLKVLSYTEGLDLFERAIGALPFRDKTLLHHRGIWMRNKGGDPEGVRAALLEALGAPQYPYSVKTEADEHIFTSLAANELDALSNGLISPDEARSRVLTYLHKARSLTFFNPHAVHVEAGLIRRLIEQSPNMSAADRATLLAESAANVDRTLMLLEHRADEPGVRLNLEMLEDARNHLLDLIPDEATAFEEAEKLWKLKKNQAGFVVCARLLYRRAATSNKGSEYFEAHQYAVQATEQVVKAGGVVDMQLHEVWLQIHYHWRVVRKAAAGVVGSTDWPRLYDVSTLLANAGGSHARYFFLYIKALAAAHLNKWTEADAVFADIRRMSLPRNALFGLRDDLLLPSGKKAVVQGEITQGGTRKFLRVKEFNTDLLLGRSADWPRPGEIAHVNVRFSFAGPMAFPAGS